MAPLLQSATTPTDGSAIVTVRGDLDADTAAQLWQYRLFSPIRGCLEKAYVTARRSLSTVPAA